MRTFPLATLSCLLLFSAIGHAQQTIVGIGAALQPAENGYIVIGNVIKGGPADKSGQIHPQDKIQGIGQGKNGRIEDITSMPLADAMALIRGDKGTVIRLDVLPGGNGPSKIVELVRDEIKIEFTPEQQLQQQIANQLRSFQSPFRRLRTEADSLNTFRSPWNEQGTWRSLNVMLRNGGESELNLTDEQKKQLSAFYRNSSLSAEWHQQMQQNPTPEYTQAEEALRAARIQDDFYFERATEEQKDAYREAYLAQLNLWASDMQTKIQETLTPEQMLKVRKFELQLMSEAVPFPSMFDVLDLTSDQKREIKRIADDLRAEFDRLTLEAAALKAETEASAYKLLGGKSFSSLEEFNKARADAYWNYAPNEALRKKNADLGERWKKLLTTLQDRSMNVLTDEQLDKMAQIFDETPEFAKKLLAHMKATRDEQKKSPTYVPGPDSWQPGKPMPVEFKEERKQGNFPRPRST